MDRYIRAAPDRLFSAWTDPAQLRLWLDPTGAPLAVCEVDARLGAALRLETADCPAHGFVGTYRRLDPPHRLEFDAMGAPGTVTFRTLGEETEMVVEIRCASAKHLAQVVAMGVAEGTAKTVDNVVARAGRVSVF